ncbi:hypothetical protein Scep_020478 [Stephania cephalantha]|uniref:Pentatricopeptide repeat-containing protein n=1 Tax=Stephania cephalantha TaxID=152367 RepID=A0AAP0NP12_9MAGN
MSINDVSSCLIKLIQRCTVIRKARELHAHVITSEATRPFVYNNVISMYAKCGSVEDSQKVFDEMRERNVVSYNALIAAYSRIPTRAVSCFRLRLMMMALEEGVIGPNGSTFSSLIQAASSLEDLLRGAMLHGQVVKVGFMSDLWVQTSLLGMYSYCGDLESAKVLHYGMVDKDDVAWNSMIFGCLKNNEIERGLQIFHSRLRSGLKPTNSTYSMVLNGCSKLGDYGNGRIIHAHVLKQDQPPDLPLQNALVHMYSSCGDTESALIVFRRCEVPDLVSWNSIIAGCSENENGEEAMFLFIELCRTSSLQPDEYTFAAVISAIGNLSAAVFGKPLHAQVSKAGFESSVFVGSTLVSMYFKNDESDSAQKIFHSITQKDIVLWTEMISSHTRLGESEDAIKYFYQMQMAGHIPDSFAISSALSACADLVTIKQGEMIHSLALKAGCDKEICVSGSLVDMYAKNGDLRAAHSVFQRVADPDLKCWNAMLGGYSNHGRAEMAIQMFDEILKNNFRPDDVTFVSLLSACSHSGMVVQAKFFWNYMKENNLAIGPKHYSCMVSLLSRAGLLQEAKDIIIEVPFSEHILALWRILLSSCMVFKNLELGLHAAEEILRLDAEDGATLILLSNLYAALERWDAVSEMRRMIRGMSLEKDPGLSWIEIMNKTHVFTSDDQTHPRLDEVQLELQRLQSNMRKSEMVDVDMAATAATPESIDYVLETAE